MLTFHDIDTFFPGAPPAVLPGSADTPDFDTLCERSAAFAAAALIDILRREHECLGAERSLLDRIGSAGSDAVFVVAGQQAGLFGGPLYTFYKALHVVRLAERLVEKTGRTVLPLFWIASDDHDIEEAGQHLALDRSGGIFHIEYRPQHYKEGAPVGDIVLDDSIHEALDKLIPLLPPGDPGDQYAEMLRDCWRPGELWRDAFSRQMLHLFKGRGLVLFDPRWEGVKALFSEVYRQEITDPLQSSQLVNEQADILESTSGKRGLRKPENSTNLFLETNGIRQALLYDGAVFGAGDADFTPDEITAIIDNEPWRISPAAGLRPICQDAAIPAVALISGPGERIYLSQLGPVYDHFGVTRSIVWPRASFTVIDRRTVRNAEKEAIQLREFFDGYDSIARRRAEDSFPENTASAFDSLETSIAEGYELLAGHIAAIDKSLSGAAAKDKGRALHALDTLRQKALRAHKSTLDLSEQRIHAACSYLLPDNIPQERRLGVDAILSMLAGEGFDELMKAASPGEEKHRILL